MSLAQGERQGGSAFVQLDLESAASESDTAGALGESSGIADGAAGYRDGAELDFGVSGNNPVGDGGARLELGDDFARFGAAAFQLHRRHPHFAETAYEDVVAPLFVLSDRRFRMVQIYEYAGRRGAFQWDRTTFLAASGRDASLGDGAPDFFHHVRRVRHSLLASSMRLKISAWLL